jgi:hypothetical protein
MYRQYRTTSTTTLISSVYTMLMLRSRHPNFFLKYLIPRFPSHSPCVQDVVPTARATRYTRRSQSRILHHHQTSSTNIQCMTCIVSLGTPSKPTGMDKRLRQGWDEVGDLPDRCSSARIWRSSPSSSDSAREGGRGSFIPSAVVREPLRRGGCVSSAALVWKPSSFVCCWGPNFISIVSACGCSQPLVEYRFAWVRNVIG